MDFNLEPKMYYTFSNAQRKRFIHKKISKASFSASLSVTPVHMHGKNVFATQLLGFSIAKAFFGFYQRKSCIELLCIML